MTSVCPASSSVSARGPNADTVHVPTSETAGTPRVCSCGMVKRPESASTSA